MRIRDFEASDLGQIKELFEKQDFEYEFPMFNQFTEVLVIEADGKIVLSVAARPTVEIYMFGDKDWDTPGMRLEAFSMAQHEMERRLVDKGYNDAHAWIPPEVSKNWGRRLRKFGWIKSIWDCYVYLVPKKVDNG